MNATPTLNRRKKVSLLALNLLIVVWSSTMTGCCYSWTTTTVARSSTPRTKPHTMSSSFVIGFQKNRDITHLRQNFEYMAPSSSTWSPSPVFGSSSSSPVTATAINNRRHHHQHIRGQQLIQRAQTLLGNVVSSVNQRGTRIHIIGAIANMLVIPIMLNINFPSLSSPSSSSSILFRQQYHSITSTSNVISHACMVFGFIGMVYDNLVTAAGKYLVVGNNNDNDDNDYKLLRILTKGRYLFHGMSC